MLVLTKENTPTILAWPSGEWQASLQRAFLAAGIAMEMPSNDRQLYWALPALNMLAVVSRPSDVPESVRTNQAAAGFTGFDILGEVGELNYSPQQRPRTPIPLKVLDPDAPEPRVYLGLTPNATRVNMTLRNALEAGPVYTSYPRLTQRMLEKLYGINLPIFESTQDLRTFWQRFYAESEQPWDMQEWKDRGMPMRGIVPRPGKVEVAWLTDPSNFAISDISSTGATARANGITARTPFFSATMQYIKKRDEELTPVEQRNTTDLLEILQRAAERATQTKAQVLKQATPE